MVADGNGRISRLNNDDDDDDNGRGTLAPVTLPSVTIDNLYFLPLRDHHPISNSDSRSSSGSGSSSSSVIDFGGRVLRNVRVEESSFEMIPKEEAGRLYDDDDDSDDDNDDNDVMMMKLVGY